MSKPAGSSLPKNKVEVDRFKDCCPRKLEKLPDAICPFGLQRARWTRDNAGYLPFQEKIASGCTWGILTEDKHSYCFFKLMALTDGQAFSEQEMALLLGLSKEQIKKIQETAIKKLIKEPLIIELKALHKEGGLFDDVPDISDQDIYFSDGFSADGVSKDGEVEDSASVLAETVAQKPSKSRQKP